MNMKTINIELTDKQHCLLTRIAKEERRKLHDLMYAVVADGLGSMFCERAVHIEKTPDEYSVTEKKQLAKNEKLKKSKGWDDLTWDERYAKGFEHVYSFLTNSIRDEKDFISELSKSIEENIYKEEGETA
tara:strand:+ start:12087 stop:12476 length:390 start_codon:yes stop_codon:yes gene_type:complete